ncbi:MAG: selenium-dependent molybdenum cofactor biosynthesis protein YqeB [Caulobacteraceae bacterium]
MNRDIVIIRGAGDIGSGIAHRLHNCGFRVLLLEDERPLVVRRKVAFAEAVLEGHAVVEGIHAFKAKDSYDVYETWYNGNIPVLCDRECNILNEIKPAILIDAIMAKKNTGTKRDMAPITIAAGPGFKAGFDVDAVIETKRGHNLGKIIYDGFAEDNTGIPGEIMSYTWQRILRAPKDGVIKNILDIGEMAAAGDVVAMVDDAPVEAPLNGVVRGLISDNSRVTEGLKIGDIDPRGIKEYCYTISDKSRAVAGGVLEAIMHLKEKSEGKRRNGVYYI